jgi:hypothetical protein
MKKVTTLSLFLFLFFTISSAQNTELPAIKAKNASAYFIPAATCTKYKLIAAKGDEWMKVYNNTANDATIQRVNDIRWLAISKEDALEWYKNNGAILNEGAKDITKTLPKPVGVDMWNVYEANDEMKDLMDGMGVAQNQYTFTFVVDKIVTKIFIGANEKVSSKDAWAFAKQGSIATLKAIGKGKLAGLVL